MQTFCVLLSFWRVLWLTSKSEKKPVTLALGGNALQEDPSVTPNLCQIIKILGVYFGYDGKQRDELNFRQTLKLIKSQDIINEIIWNNRFICIGKKSIYRRDIVVLSCLKIGDFFSTNSLATNPRLLFLTPE